MGYIYLLKNDLVAEGLRQLIGRCLAHFDIEISKQNTRSFRQQSAHGSQPHPAATAHDNGDPPV